MATASPFGPLWIGHQVRRRIAPWTRLWHSGRQGLRRPELGTRALARGMVDVRTRRHATACHGVFATPYPPARTSDAP
jgi:hypothetical protein